MLRQLPSVTDPNLLAGSNPVDDAAVYRLSDDLALVQTLDFFTPIVDDPHAYGRIAAANALSDIYAVGGTPITALNILCVPQSLPRETVAAILQGGAQKAAEAGVPIVGGHTIDDLEPKYGLSLTGTVSPSKFISAHGARPGDRILLSKPIGTGVVSTATKAGSASATHVQVAIQWMETLNRQASKAMVAAEAHAATDITGYGLLGHLSDLCAASGVSARIQLGAIPLLPGALAYARGGYVPGGTSTNRAFVSGSAEIPTETDDAMDALLHDPQTSGGLLVCLSADRIDVFRHHVGSQSLAADIGEIEAGPAGRIAIEA